MKLKTLFYLNFLNKKNYLSLILIFINMNEALRIPDRFIEISSFLNK
jgi:hypothetical protein